MEKIQWLIPVLAAAALLFAYSKARYVMRSAPGNSRMQEIASAIAEGADAFLRSQKGFGIYGCGSDTRHMYAAMLAMSAFITDKWSGAAAASAVLEDAMEAGFRAMSINTMAASNNLSMMLQNTLKEISGR